MIKVLLIEDNPGDARLIQEMVSGADGAAFDLEHVDRLSTGLKHIVAAGDIDLVLLDLGLPDSSGFDTFTIVQTQAPEVAIVVLTGLEDKTIENKALQAGAQDYLSKNQLDSNSLIRSMRYAIERKKAERRIEHLNSVLKAIRNVKQLIVAEKNRDSLLQKACDALIETRAYNAAWLGFLQDDETFATVVGSGFSEDVSRFCRHVMNGNPPPCIKKALAQKDHLVLFNKSRKCGDCFFKDACVSKDAVIIRVEHADRFFGLLAVLLAPDVTVDDEEKELLQEVASDIGLALHNMKLEEVLLKKEKFRQRQNKMLTEMAKSKELYRGVLHDALRIITEAVAHTFEVQMVSVWLFTENRSMIRCIDMYELSTDNHSQGMELKAVDYPAYFKALAEEELIAAHDARNDPRTCEFSDSYLAPLGITSMLDVPIRLKGQIIGIVCYEHMGPARKWSLTEQNFARAPADYISLAMEAEERRQAEETLRKTKNRYKHLYSMVRLMCDNMPDLIWTKDLEGKFVFANKACCEKLLNAKSTDEPIGKTDMYFASRERESHPENPDYHTFGETCLATDLAVMKRKRPQRFEESGNIKGKFLVLDVYKAPFWDEKHNMIGMVGCAKDVTKKKQFEEEHRQAEKDLAKYRDHLEVLVKERTRDLEAAQEELVKREKLSVLGQLTATVSHEIRNPLGVIRSSAFYLQRKLGGKDEKADKHLNRIENQVTLCDTIVGDLLEFTRGRHSEVIHGEINPLLKKILEEMATPEQVTLISDLSPKLPMVHFDRDKMRRVVINLVLNAFTAVTMRREKWDKGESPYQPLVKVTSSKADNGIRIEVEDNGTGMDDETAKRALEPLFTTWARGTGLGLAIVKKIVEEHGGSVSLESIPDHGTKVTVIIPKKVKS
ncbi:MAG: ATP-binding protein [Thermodesulfobacteriota bacterium]|nr:ATP-binding protein [Thermodesulfobacteriota bacterium]